MRNKFLFLLFVLLVLFCGWFTLNKLESGKENIVVGPVSIPVEIRDTPEGRKQGLSGRESLPADEGMLFVFPTKDTQQFWMPDMHFPIDIVWITGGKVVGIEANVSNKFDSDNPVYYSSPEPVDYVLEVNAGFMARHNLKVGEAVDLNNI